MNVCNYSAPGEYIEVAKHQCSSSFILKMEFILVHFQQHLSHHTGPQAWFIQSALQASSSSWLCDSSVWLYPVCSLICTYYTRQAYPWQVVSRLNLRKVCKILCSTRFVDMSTNHSPLSSSGKRSAASVSVTRSLRCSPPFGLLES